MWRRPGTPSLLSLEGPSPGKTRPLPVALAGTPGAPTNGRRCAVALGRGAGSVWTRLPRRDSHLRPDTPTWGRRSHTGTRALLLPSLRLTLLISAKLGHHAGSPSTHPPPPPIYKDIDSSGLYRRRSIPARPFQDPDSYSRGAQHLGACEEEERDRVGSGLLDASARYKADLQGSGATWPRWAPLDTSATEVESPASRY